MECKTEKVQGNNFSENLISEKVTFRNGPVSKPQETGSQREGSRNLTFLEIPLEITILFL